MTWHSSSSQVSYKRVKVKVDDTRGVILVDNVNCSFVNLSLLSESKKINFCRKTLSLSLAKHFPEKDEFEHFPTI